MQHEFTAFPRGTEGRGASRRLRRSGRAPGIVYGGDAKPQPVELDHNALIHALRKEAFHSSILTMKFEGAAQRVLLRDVQMHPFRNEVLHVDFPRVIAEVEVAAATADAAATDAVAAGEEPKAGDKAADKAGDKTDKAEKGDKGDKGSDKDKAPAKKDDKK